MTKALDLRAPQIAIRFDKGKTLKPIFYFLGPAYEVINLTGYHARMQARVKVDDGSPVLDLSTDTAGLDIIIGTATVPGRAPITNAQGVQLNVTDAQTAAFTWQKAFFDIELIEPGGTVLPFIKGILMLDYEVTR